MKHDKHHPIIYLIRHGEKDAKLPDGQDPVGLSVKGLERARGLVSVFGHRSHYNIGCIIAQKPKKDGRQSRPYLTVAPLAESLGLEVIVKFDRDEIIEVAEKAQKFKGPGNVLVCWEHERLALIAKALGVKHYAKETGWKGHPEYPRDRFDLIWTIEPPYEEITKVTSEGVVPIDEIVSGQMALPSL